MIKARNRSENVDIKRVFNYRNLHAACLLRHRGNLLLCFITANLVAFAVDLHWPSDEETVASVKRVHQTTRLFARPGGWAADNLHDN